MKKTVAYIRVSTEDQYTKYGPEIQRKEIREFCKGQGWKLDHFYEDAVSGSTNARAAFQEMLTGIRAGEIGRVIIHRLDRLARDLYGQLDAIKKNFIPYNSDLHISTMPFMDLSTPHGRLLFNNMGAIAEYERELIRLRTEGGRRMRAESGRSNTKPPYGYQSGDAGETFTPDPQTAPIVRRIFSDYLKLGSLGKLKKALDRDGITNTKGRPFSRPALQHLLKNSYYIGEVTYKDIRAAGQHEPLISKNLFGRVQNALKAQNKHRDAA